nr:SurA N-terminal domain-containing protein [Alicyclobacillus sp. ALC3]
MQTKISRTGPWSWIVGGVIGAVVVGAVWGGVAYAHAGGPLIAKVGNTGIRQSALYNKLQTSYGNSMVQELVSEQLITDAATKYHIAATQAQLNTALSALEAQYQITSPTQLNLFLAQNNMTQADLNHILKLQVLEQNLAQRNVKITNTEIQSYYNQNKSTFIPTGKKTPAPLSQVKSQIVATLKQQKALSSTQLFASIAKWDPITIYDSKYAGVKSQIVGSGASSTSSAANVTSSGNTVSIP